MKLATCRENRQTQHWAAKQAKKCKKIEIFNLKYELNA